MGYIIRLKRNQLVGGSNNDEIYPITSTNAVYRGGKNLEDILNEIGRETDSKKVTEVSYNESTNSIEVSYSNGDISNYTLSEGLNVSVTNKNATLTADSTVTIATINIDGADTDIKANVPKFVVNNNSIKNIEYCATEDIYNSSNKDQNTLYFIPVE